MTTQPDVVIIMTDEERAAPSYESAELTDWRSTLNGSRWFNEHAVSFNRHYTGSLACVPSRPTLFTGQYPDVHGVTQTDGLGKMADDSRMRWLREGEIPTLGHWFRAAGYDTHYDGKWHITHADLLDDNGEPLPTNTAEGEILHDNVDRYLDANPLDPFGFSGWVGPEPHGGLFANCGLARDPLIAARVVRWLNDRYERRRNGDADALKPFLLVASFVNPHDIVLFPLWIQRGMPSDLNDIEVPDVPLSPSDFEDLRHKPAAQVAYRAAYPSCYGPYGLVAPVYQKNLQDYRNLYYRLHEAVDQPVDLVRAAITDNAATDTVIVRTSDHGELLGSHGGLHQKWFQLYDESTRVPFSIARIGSQATSQRSVSSPTSHVDLVPTLLSAAGIDEQATADELRSSFSEVHPLPGRNLMPVVDGTEEDEHRSVYIMTRDNMPEGDTGASGAARAQNNGGETAGPLRINVAAHVATNFEGIVGRVDDSDAPGGGGHLWKLVRTFDDPATWTEPHVRQLASDGMGGPRYRTSVLSDQWELYDLDGDPVEMANRWNDDSAAGVFTVMRERLDAERERCLPPRNAPWPYVTSNITSIDKVPLLPPRPMIQQAVKTRVPQQVRKRIAERRSGPRPSIPPPARLVRRALQRAGLHPEMSSEVNVDLTGRHALVIATNHGTLGVGRPTGVFASELTVPYYEFVDAGMTVTVASPLGGEIPVDPLSLKPALRTSADDRMLGDPSLKAALTSSRAVGDLDISQFDLIYFAGGWGAAFDLGTSPVIGEQVTKANANGAVLGGVCHGPLGFLHAKNPDGSPLVAGRRLTAVTDKQVQELGITSTPQHPERELRNAGAVFESTHRRRDFLANHWVVDGNIVTGQNQNAAEKVAHLMLEAIG